MSDQGTLTVERWLPYPPQEVWRALTDPALLAQWWAAGDVRPTVGHGFTLDMGEFGQQPCHVVAVDPEHLMVYRFSDGAVAPPHDDHLAPSGGRDGHAPVS